LGATLLLLGLLALVLGVFGAVYLDQFQSRTAPQLAASQPPATGPVAPAPVTPPPAPSAMAGNIPQNQSSPPLDSKPAATPAPPSQVEATIPALRPAAPTLETPPIASQSPQTQPAAPVITPETPPAAPLATTEAAPPAPAIPPTTPPASAEAQAPSLAAPALAQITPTEARAIAAGPRYWVEFSLYDRAFYADQLVDKLGKLGIAATVTPITGREGRHYLRVRTAGDLDPASATTAVETARNAFKISPLLHHTTNMTPEPPRAVTAVTARVAASPPSGDHWVQFGAFRLRENATDTIAQLLKKDVQASIIEVQSKDNPRLFLVRASGLTDRAQATQIAQLGMTALHSTDVLIGETSHAPAAMRSADLPAAPPPR
jgi:hypothetical protein